MLHVLKRHPFSVSAQFGHCLVLTYAFDEGLLQPILPPGLVVDAFAGFGFVAIALVQTHRLRPAFLPEAFGMDLCLCGYRVFTRVAGGAGSLRGLRILRSGTDRRLMARAGNLFTHYNYRVCEVGLQERPGEIHWSVRTPAGDADLEVVAKVNGGAVPLPAGSPFMNDKDARRFAGPLPYAFDYEAETNSLIRIRGVRPEWHPKSVAVDVRVNTFFTQEPFCRAVPVLASAFHVHDVPYRWERGTRVPLEVSA